MFYFVLPADALATKKPKSKEDTVARIAGATVATIVIVGIAAVAYCWYVKLIESLMAVYYTHSWI